MELLFLVFLLVINGLFSMAELAVVSSRKVKLQSDADRGDRRAVAALALLESPSIFLATVQVGITLIGIIAGVFGGAALANDFGALLAKVPLLEPISAVLAYVLVVALITYLSLVIGELIPKRLALAYPEAIAKGVTGPIGRISRLGRPLVWFLEATTELVLKPFQLPVAAEANLSEEDIRSVVEQGSESGVIEEEEGEIIHRVFRLGDRVVAALMTPRNDVVSLRVDVPWEKNLEAAMASRRTWFPVVAGSTDEIFGVVSIHDVLEIDQTENRTSERLREFISVPVRIPESATALKLLERFRTERSRFALVFDEYGGFAGIATVHDVVEAIVGELGNADEELPSVHRREDGSLLVDASIDISELWRLLDICDVSVLDEGVFHSLGGFIMTTLGRVPREGEALLAEGYRFEVVDMDHFRIDKVLISKMSEDSAY